MQSIRDEEQSGSTAIVISKDQMEEEDTAHVAESDPAPEPQSFASNVNGINSIPSTPTLSGGLTEEQRKIIEAKRQEVQFLYNVNVYTLTCVKGTQKTTRKDIRNSTAKSAE